VGTANPEELAMITEVLDAYSTVHGLTAEYRERAGAFLVAEFNKGARTRQELAEALTHYLVRR
jgi:hypothetical protein